MFQRTEIRLACSYDTSDWVNGTTDNAERYVVCSTNRFACQAAFWGFPAIFGGVGHAGRSGLRREILANRSF